jgi:DNA-binding XRE family transcriptional regulator
MDQITGSRGAVHCVRCRYCRLNQYDTVSRKCRRCGKWLYAKDEDKHEETMPAPIEPLPSSSSLSSVSPGMHYDSYSFWFPFIITALRELNGLTQQQCADRIGVPRQYLCRVERGNTMPYMRMMPRYARAVGVSMYELLRMCEHMM